MRRFVQAFGLKRDKHDHDAHKNPYQPSKSPLKALAIPFLSSSSLTTPSVPETATPPVHSPSSSSYSTPHLSSASSNPSSHSSGSSSGSASLSIQTPDDDRNSLSLTRTDTKRSWKAWIGGKRSSSMKLRDRKEKPIVDKALPQWDPLSLPVAPSLLPPTFQVTGIADDTDDDMHISSVSDFGYNPSTEGPNSTTVPPPSLADAKRYLQISIESKLVPNIHAAPFVQPSSGTIYPRSCNNHTQLTSGRPTLHSTMMRKHLLKRIDDHGQDLTPLEQASILPFCSLPAPVELTPPAVALEFNIPYPDKASTILPNCPGLRKWICRPCFEDRFVVYLASEQGQVFRTSVSTTHAVAALDYSEILDVMVDPDFDLDRAPIPDSLPSLPEPVSPTTIREMDSKPSLQVAPSASNPRRNSHTAIPSPLRNEHTAGEVAMPPGETTISSPRQQDIIPKSVTAVKRVVRFANDDDDDDDDGIPLHLLRMKKKREEKSKFLRQERQRRMKEAWEQQQQREREAAERERKRIAMEKERKEREQRLYAEQVAASRQRREQARAGAYAVDSNSSSSLLVPPLATSRGSERNKPRSPSYSSPRTETSEFGVHGSSSGGSRFSSRPPSTYSVSSEEARSAPGSRRNSGTPSMSGSMRSMPSAMRTMTYPYPGWAGNGMVNGMPQLAAFAAVSNDMPLLPPTAPFMKHSRQSSPAGDSRDRRQSSGSLNSVSSRNHSNSSLRREPASPTSSHYPSDHRPSNHTRQSSHDSRGSRRSSTTQSRPHPQTSQSSPSISRGRPAVPQYRSSPQVQQVPSPWTALPSRTGEIPTAMPVSPYTHAPTRPGSGFVGPMGHDWRSTFIS